MERLGAGFESENTKAANIYLFERFLESSPRRRQTYAAELRDSRRIEVSSSADQSLSASWALLEKTQRTRISSFFLGATSPSATSVRSLGKEKHP